MHDLGDDFPKFGNKVKGFAERWRTVFPWVYWPCAGFCALLMIVGIPVVGVLAAVLPAVLYWRTRKIGLDRVNPVLYYAPFVPLGFIAFFAGLYYLGSGHQHITPLIVVGAVTFIVSTYGFATMLNQQHKAYVEKERPADYDAYRDNRARFRVLEVKVVIATCVLFATKSPILLFCLIALAKRNKLTAFLAAALVCASVWISFGGGHWTFETAKLAAGVRAAQVWILAGLNPFWLDSGRLTRVGRVVWRLLRR